MDIEVINKLTLEVIKHKNGGNYNEYYSDKDLMLDIKYVQDMAKVISNQMNVAYGYVKDVATSMEIVIDRERLSEEAIRSYTRVLGTEVPIALKPVIEKNVEDIYKTTRKAIAQVSMALPDKEAINFLADVDKFYVGKIFDKYKSEVTEVIKKATFEQGLGALDTAKEIRNAIGNKVTAEFYRYATVARTSANRVRNWSRVLTYHVLEVHNVEFVAMMDERTTAICEAMNGSIFSVEKQYERICEIESSGEENVEDFPFPKLEDIIDSDGNRISEGDIQAMGYDVPPLHCNCRSLLVFYDPHINADVSEDKQIESYIDSELDKYADKGFRRDIENEKYDLLSDSDVNTIIDYTKFSYKDTNKYLRYGDDKDFALDFFDNKEQLKAYIVNLDSALAKLPNVDEGIVMRTLGVKNDSDYKRLVDTYSKDFICSEFMSTSFRLEKISNSIENQCFAFIVPKTGKSIAQWSYRPGEREVLFRPGSKFKVIKFDRNDELKRFIGYYQEIE
jgi:SPP1 gp7 family putative phage head morphogenesis protein